MFDFKCLFCGEIMPFATSKGYHKTCVRAMTKQITTSGEFTLDLAWKQEIQESELEDNTTIDMGADPTYNLDNTTDPISEDSWEGKTEIITYTPNRVLADIA